MVDLLKKLAYGALIDGALIHKKNQVLKFLPLKPFQDVTISCGPVVIEIFAHRFCTCIAEDALTDGALLA